MVNLKITIQFHSGSVEIPIHFSSNASGLPSNFLKKTDKSISTITFTWDDIASLIKNLDPDKAHGQYIISIRMLKLCGKSIS